MILGGYFGAAGAVLVPFYNAIGGYGSDAAADAAYHESYAMLLIFMTILLLFFTIASLRLDLCHVVLFTCFTICFPCLAASYFYVADGNADAARAARLRAASFSAIGTVIFWYLVSGSSIRNCT